MKTILQILAVIAIVYLVAASMIFQFRHPWMTDMELLINIKSMLCYETVSYQEARYKYE